MRLVWLPEARHDIERLHLFLAEKNPETAARAVRQIIDGAERLRRLPELGRLMPDNTKRREYFLPFGASAYELRYRLTPTEVVIIRVWHGREDREESA
jgi:plasmid stabilization system protein ParE